MPNWCFADLMIKTKSIKDAETLEKEFEKAFSSNPLNTGYGNVWLGNLLLQIGMPEEDVIRGPVGCRGSALFWEREEDAIHENFSYWDNRDTDECFFGISILIDDQGYTGKEMGFDSSNPDKMPTILLEDDYWQVESMRLFGKYDVELNLISNGNRKTVRIPEVDIEKKEAYKLLCAVFDNTEHEKDEGEDYEDVEDFYGWELS